MQEIHWAETIFKIPTPTRSRFRKSNVYVINIAQEQERGNNGLTSQSNPEMSEAYGPLKPLGQLGSLSPDAKNLVTRCVSPH